LHRLVQTLTGNKEVVKVGILGDDVNRDEAGVTNAEVGAVHEFGSFTKNVPQRSFLRKALNQKAEQITLAVSKSAKKALEKNDFGAVLKKLGVAAVGAVRECFATEGWGSWPQLSYRTLMARLRKGKKKSVEQRKQLVAEQLHEGGQSAAILRDTSQLMRSISYRVDKRD
jgi:hypothetical protein